MARIDGARASNWAQLEAAQERLSPAHRDAWEDAWQVTEHGQDPDALARIRRACAHLPDGLPVPHPAKEDAEAWADAALNVPGGAPLLAPPAERVPAFLAYFEACAAWCVAEAVRVPLSPDVHRLARWGAALWTFEAALCGVLAGGTA